MEKGHLINVLDHGFVRYVDHMGSDERIVEAARLSYKSPSKGIEADKKLLDYLWKNKHCYHGEMQVLTVNGWKKWKDLDKKEKFLVPNPETYELTVEELDVLKFDCDEDLFCFKNERMSYKVTTGHRMYFKPKYRDFYSIFKVNEMSKWGNFKTLDDISIKEKHPKIDAELKYVGFFLGDGSSASKNTVTFHIDKHRKQDYLISLCNDLNLEFKQRPSSSHRTAVLFTITGSEFILDKYINKYKKAKDKSFDYELHKLDRSQLLGLYDGLINSDGSLSKDRPQVSFYSASESLINLFDTLGAYLGVPTHLTSTGVCSFPDGRTSLESRKSYHHKEKYKGDVYCATTSTGLLCVRGGSSEFGFICGNTSPFEMCKVTLNIKMPIFVMRQYVRHRMQNLNEVSARYTELPNEFYIPSNWRKQDTTNKQGSVEDGQWNPQLFGDGGSSSTYLKIHCEESYKLYEMMLSRGIAREMARMVLPVNIYTECYVCWDLKNLLHFITLRDDSHAQAEIQEYGKAIKAIISELFPFTMEVYDKYKNEFRKMVKLDN